MNQTQKFMVAAVLVAAGILAVVFPIWEGVLCVTVATAGIVYAMCMGTVCRTVLRTRGARTLTMAAYVIAAAGVLLILNRFWGFVDARYLMLAELVAVGWVTIGLGLQCKDGGLRVWPTVVIAGIGTVAAGLFALLRVEAVFTVGCVTAVILLFRKDIMQLCIRPKDEKGRKIVTIKAKDIEIIPAEEEENKQ